MIAVYKTGNTHIVQGVECEIHRLPNSKLEWALQNGFSLSPQDLDNREPVDDFPGDMADNPVEKVPELEPVDEVALRAQAKALGINSSHNKKLDNLVEEINARLQT